MIPLFRNFPGIALAAFGWITLGFAVLDLCLTRFQLLERWTRDWNPASLPPLAKDVKEEPASVFGILVGAFFSAWWLAGIKFPYLVLGPVAASLAFGPIWHQLYPLMLFAAAGQVVKGWIHLFRPEWRRFRAVSRVFFDGVDLVVLYLLVKAGNWFIVPVGAESFPGSLVEMINLATGLGLLLALVCASVAFAWAWLQRGFRFFRGEHDGTPSHVASSFALLALFPRFARARMTMFDSLRDNAYGMYLVHYAFVSWLQYALLTAPLSGLVKGTVVFLSALVLSWGATAAFRRIPAVARVI